jgi:phenylpyruvate tautomerase PptA (4-oxalocrotonate tautomerase family)
MQASVMLALSLGALGKPAFARGGDAMPLMKFDVIEGRSEAEIQTLLDAAHRAMVAAFAVPERDRYQILQEHPRTHMIVEDTGLGIERTDKVVVVQVISRKRTREKKEALYRLLTEALEKSCGIKPSDVMVSIVENGDEDWSFGLGRAQFLTREL